MAELTATIRRATQDAVTGNGYAYKVTPLVATVEQGVAAVNDTIDFGQIPSNARILGISTIYNDDLAAAGAPTMDIGLFAVDSNITSDADALTNGIDLATASGDTGVKVINDFADYSKKAWEFVSGQTVDPKGCLSVKGTVLDAVTDAVGTVTLELYYTID